jgi:protein-S-isoprenylcysteine O-methyltransferase Ste14
MESVMRTVLRYLIGYAVGVGIFYGILPFCLVSLSRGLDPILGTATSAIPGPRAVLALALCAVGLVFAMGSNAALLFQGQGGPTDGFGIAVSPRTRILVTSGLYRYTRNPMVFGTNLVYLSIVVHLGSVSGLVVLALFISVLIPYLRWAEERRLLADFGQEYLHYRQRTPLLIPGFRRSDDEVGAASGGAPTARGSGGTMASPSATMEGTSGVHISAVASSECGTQKADQRPQKSLATALSVGRNSLRGVFVAGGSSFGAHR